MNRKITTLMQQAIELEDYSVLKKLYLPQRTISIYGQIPIIRREDGTVNLRATFAEDWEIEFANEGESYIYTSTDIKYMINFYANTDWSAFNIQAQTKSEFNSGVPLLLYAQRLFNNIPYSAWREEIANLSALSILGKQFMAMDFEEKPEFSEEEILRLRVEMTTPAKGGTSVLTSFKSNRTAYKKFDTLPATYRRMITQTWIYNVAYRSKAMLLDWNDWDNIPEALDATTSFKLIDNEPKKISRPKKEKAIISDLPF